MWRKEQLFKDRLHACTRPSRPLSQVPSAARVSGSGTPRPPAAAQLCLSQRCPRPQGSSRHLLSARVTKTWDKRRGQVWPV